MCSSHIPFKQNVYKVGVCMHMCPMKEVSDGFPVFLYIYMYVGRESTAPIHCHTSSLRPADYIRNQTAFTIPSRVDQFFWQ